PDIPGIAMSRIRQLVWGTTSDAARNASAEENTSTAKPNARSRSGSDSRTDSSSSTTETTEGLPIVPAVEGSVVLRPTVYGTLVYIAGVQGMENAKVAPGPSFGSAQRRP